MLLLPERLIGVPVLSLQTGTRIAQTTEPIIDPRRLHIVAFYCTGVGLESGQSVLHTSDVREFSEMGMIVNSSDDIMPQDDLVRLKEILEFEFKLPGMKVVDTTGKKLGKVSEYMTDTASFLVQKLIVKRPLFQALNVNELVIARQQIAEITKEHIVVKAPTVEDKATAKAPIGNFENPFRAPSKPQEN